MNIIIYILQGLIAFIFLFSGINKAYFDEATLVQKGQTGVEGIPKWFIKFIGVSEILGATALMVSALTDKWTILTPTAAICLASIMVPAAYIHFMRKEPRNVMINIVILTVCVLIAWYRLL